jgi:aspartate aminotransferase
MAYTPEELRAIADLALKHKFYIISDEVYEHLMYDGRKSVSIASLGEDVKDITIVVNGVSKSYAMTGWRIGYTASNEKIASIMANVQSHATSNPNSIAQAAAVAALDGDQTCVEEMRKVFEERRNYMVDRINRIEGVSCLRPHGAFYVFMNVSKLLNREYYGQMVTTSDQLCEMLLEHAKLALVPGTGFEAPEYVRWSYATSMETIKEGLDRLEGFLAGK